MADRIDIDALLIGALYGELSSAEEARLTAHLESHPADRAALEDLKSARQAVRDSRIFAVQVEPPQPISAILLQEAARRAPRRVRERDDSEQESWFHRFISSFSRHPAMAAAAMLVLVLGVAGTLALKGGIKDASVKEAPVATGPTLAEKAPADHTAAGSAAAPAPAPAIEAQGQAAQQDSFSADLKMDEAAEAERHVAQGITIDGKGGKLAAKPTAPSPTKATDQRPKKKQMAGIEVDAPRAMPKDLDEGVTGGDSDRDGIGTATASGNVVVGRGAGNGFAKDRAQTVAPSTATTSAASTGHAGPAPGMAPQQPSPTPPPPPPAPRTVSKNDAKAPERAAVADKEVPANDASTTEVRKMHAQAQALARNGQCSDAAKLVLAIERSNLGYYNANVATDRVLKPCQAYLTQEREKARAAEGKRARSLDEAPAPSK